ncbi:MAG: CheY-like chemotaxis protein [Neolewinella sp.]|jgi:CheY-like chemotaxis protein
MTGTADILFVDPTRLLHKMVDQLCSSNNATCRHASSTVQALSMIAECAPSAIVAGLEQPDFSAISLVAALRSHGKLASIPIAVLTTESAAGVPGIYQPDRLVRRDTEWLAQLTDFLLPILEAPEPATSEQGNKPRVLLVEDSATTQRLVARILHLGGCEVTIASDGRTALDTLASDPFDLVLMDIEMPVMDGREAIAIMRDEGNMIPVFALTALTAKEFGDEADALGFTGLCSKPIRQDLLMDLVVQGMAAAEQRTVAPS